MVQKKVWADRRKRKNMVRKKVYDDWRKLEPKQQQVWMDKGMRHYRGKDVGDERGSPTMAIDTQAEKKCNDQKVSDGNSSNGQALSSTDIVAQTIAEAIAQSNKIL